MPDPITRREPSRAQLLCRFFSPSWLFQDASRGSLYERAAAYRHNRSMRGHLPAYLRRWLLACGVASVLTACCEALGTSGGGAIPFFGLLAAACAIFFACGVCMLFVTAYAYLYLCRNER